MIGIRGRCSSEVVGWPSELNVMLDMQRRLRAVTNREGMTSSDLPVCVLSRRSSLSHLTTLDKSACL